MGARVARTAAHASPPWIHGDIADLIGNTRLGMMFGPDGGITGVSFVATDTGGRRGLAERRAFDAR